MVRFQRKPLNYQGVPIKNSQQKLDFHCHQVLPPMCASSASCGLVELGLLGDFSLKLSMILHTLHPFTSIYIHLHPFTSIYIHLHPFTSIYIHLHPFTSIYIHLHPFTSIYIHLHPFTSIYIHLHPFTSIYIHLHPFTSIYIHLHPFTVCNNIFSAERTTFSNWCVDPNDEVGIPHPPWDAREAKDDQPTKARPSRACELLTQGQLMYGQFHGGIDNYIWSYIWWYIRTS